MGEKATAAIRARQREVTARVERLIARADDRALIGSARRAAIKSAVRDGRRGLTARDRAEASIAAAENDVGTALIRIVEAGLSFADAFEALGLTTAVGRRLHARAVHAAGRDGSPSSTDPGLGHPRSTEFSHGETNATSRGTTEGNP